VVSVLDVSAIKGDKALLPVLSQRKYHFLLRRKRVYTLLERALMHVIFGVPVVFLTFLLSWRRYCLPLVGSFQNFDDEHVLSLQLWTPLDQFVGILRVLHN